MAEPPRAKRLRLDSELLSLPGCTKNALAEILTRLHASGLLVSGVGGGSARAVRRALTQASTHHSAKVTPYGPVVQQLDLGTEGPIDYVNPFAYLYYLSSICHAFGDMLVGCMRGIEPLRLVIYIDEICPGNPLRPDKGRTTEAIYWCFAEWPEWLLHRSAAWLLFGAVRTSIVNRLPGGVSGLMRQVMNVFFSRAGHSFARGTSIVHRDSNVVLRAKFGGFLADEKAHKEILGVKGAAGTKPCTTCKNVVQFIDTADLESGYLVGIDCAEYERLDYHSNDSFYAMADRLSESRETMSKKQFARLEQTLGLNYVPDGLLFDTHLRTILCPVDNCIRDWMHTMVSGGIVGTEVALIIAELRGHGVKYDTMIEFSLLFHLPRSRGNVHKSWFSEQRVSEDSLRSFASEQLSMLPILLCFLTDVIQPMGIMTTNIRCFSMLVHIVNLLTLGAESAVQYSQELRQTIIDHHTLYRELYPDAVKPKWHHLLHIPETMIYIGRLLSCFVTERKHRTVKGAALHIFRHYEHTLIADLVNRQSQSYLEDNLFCPSYLVLPRTVQLPGQSLRLSTSAVIHCGELHKGDVVAIRPNLVGEVAAFWQAQDESIVVEVLAYRASSDDHSFDVRNAATCFANVASIVAPCVWAKRRDGVIRAMLPVHF